MRHGGQDLWRALHRAFAGSAKHLRQFFDARLVAQRLHMRGGATVGDAATSAVRVDLDPSQLALRPGMTGEVEIVVK